MTRQLGTQGLRSILDLLDILIANSGYLRLDRGREYGDRIAGTKNRDAMEGLQVAQVLVAGDDEIGSRRKGAGKHRVVIRIRRRARDCGGDDAFGQRFVELKHFGRRAVLAFQAPVYMLATEHLGQFRQKRFGSEEVQRSFGRKLDQARRGA